MLIVVLGHLGMLGHVVCRYLGERGHEVRSVSRRFAGADAADFFAELNSLRPEWCVNCIAALPHTGGSVERGWEVNAGLPQMCASMLSSGTQWIQPSTDGVFVPEKPQRAASDTPDAEDWYGRSKQAAETAARQGAGHVIRCSIIGPELGSKRNLLSWFLSQSGMTPGFINQCWNGITTLEFARLVDRIICGQPAPAAGIWQPGVWPPLSKFDLLELADRVFGRNGGVAAACALTPVSRSLVPNVPCPSIGTQLEELRDWYPFSTSMAA